MGFDPFLHPQYFATKLLLTGLDSATEESLLSVQPAIKRESQKVKGLRFPFSPSSSVFFRKSAEFQYLCLFFSQSQAVLCKPRLQSLSEYFRFIFVLEATYKVIGVSDEIALSLTLSLYYNIEPVIKYIV